jgi:hypothetical protein
MTRHVSPLFFVRGPNSRVKNIYFFREKNITREGPYQAKNDFISKVKLTSAPLDESLDWLMSFDVKGPLMWSCTL